MFFIKTWGTRGSCATAENGKLEYGGNTICYQILQHSDEHIIIDAGTGIVPLGRSLPDSGILHLFLSHWHLDHIFGLGFLKALHSPNWEVNLYLPYTQSHIINDFFNEVFFPVKASHLRCKLNVHELSDDFSITIGGIKIESPLVPHSGICHAFKLSKDEGCAAILSDVEVSEDNMQALAHVKSILQDVSVAFVDTYFTAKEYKPSWGHTAFETWIEHFSDCNIEHLVATHHHIDRSDAELKELEKNFVRMAKDKAMRLSFAKEGLRYDIKQNKIFDSLPIFDVADWVDKFSQEILGYDDPYIVLDRILQEARILTQAEAGTVYLVEGDDIVFSYTHNDKLFTVDKASKFAYSNIRIPIAKNSIAGYCAYRKQVLNLDDVRKLPETYPFKFNDSFDKTTNYITKSMFCVPLLGHNEQLLGVLQLINRVEDSVVVPFPDRLIPSIKLLAMQATNAIERSKIVQEMVLRMQHIVGLADPNETGLHVERVGAVSAELYRHIAHIQGVDADKAYTMQSQIRLAAKLHDIGKVGIPKEILKKPGKLTDEEFETMKQHTGIGANIFSLTMDTTDNLAKNVALHHHQKWNGRGYSGAPNVPILAGEDIPLEARIVAVADVFDALISKRSYKPSWTWEQAVDVLRQDSGSHFDPLVVDSFCAIEDIIKSIYDKFVEEL